MLTRIDHNGIVRLTDGAIERVERQELPYGHYSDYAERPTAYMVQLQGEKRLRRVYVTPIGNVCVMYLKIKGERVYCESALDWALYRKD